MKNAIILQSTVLLTPSGWAQASSLSASPLLTGIDRHGRPREQSVSLNLLPSTKSDTTYFLGSPNALNVFSEYSYIVDQSGARVQVASFSHIREPGNHYFEAYTSLTSSAYPEFSCFSSALFNNSDKNPGQPISFRLRNTENLNLPSFLDTIQGSYVKQVDEAFFLIFTLDQLKIAFQGDWASTVQSIASIWRSESSEPVYNFDRTQLSLALWTLSACRHLGDACTFEFDTIQHTAIISISPQKSLPNPITRAACAFRSVYPGAYTEITWDEKGWAPIAGGFLLSNSEASA